MGRWRLAAAVLGATVVGVSAVGISVAAAAPVYGTYVPTNTTIERAPYLSDLTASSVEVNWAIGGKNPSPGYVEYGVSPACTGTTVKPSANGLPPFVPTSDSPDDTSYEYTVAGANEYQDSVKLTGLSAGTNYCYEVFSSAGVLLSPAQSFSTLDATTSTTPLTFDIVGDLGETVGADESSKYVNEDQAAIDTEIGQSGAKFLVTAGDFAYTGGTNTDFGDLTHPATSTTEQSNVFGNSYWPETGGIPTFEASGNHGENITGSRTFPEEATATASGGAYDYTTYPADSLIPKTSTPNQWYAVQDGNVRIYVIDGAWSDGSSYLATTKATGSECAKNADECEGYQIDAFEHWQSTSPEMEWLKADLAAHPGAVKFAVFHYPLQSMNNDQQSDPYETPLESVLEQYGVSMAFNGHAHTYQRFYPDAGSGQMISYVSGGGGGTLEPVDGNSDKSGLCAAELTKASVYAIGWSSSGGSACSTGAAVAKPSAAAQVYNFLKVTVSGNQITVTPMNALNQAFDAQTYTDVNGVTTLNGGGTTPPTSTTTSTSTSTSTSTTSTTSTTQGSGGISPVQNATSTTKTVTLPGPTKAGDTLVLSAAVDTGATNHITAISGTGLTWNLAVDAHSSGHDSDGEIWYASNVPAGITAVTVTTGAGTTALDLQEFSGLGTAPTVAASGNSNTSTSATQTQSGTGLAVGFVTGNGSNQTITPVSGWTSQGQVTAGTSNLTSLVEGYEPTTGSATYGGSWATAMYFAVGVAVFTPG